MQQNLLLQGKGHKMNGEKSAQYRPAAMLRQYGYGLYFKSKVVHRQRTNRVCFNVGLRLTSTWRGSDLYLCIRFIHEDIRDNYMNEENSITWECHAYVGTAVNTLPESSVGAASFLTVAAATAAKYEITFFVFSVFPAPDSPLMRKETQCKWHAWRILSCNRAVMEVSE